MSSPFSEAIAAVSLAYGLYSKVWVVARRAPEDFKDLLDELNLVKQVLFRIAETLKDVEDPLAESTIKRCKEILDKFRPLVSRYHRLASTDGNVWSTRAKYVMDQKVVRECRKELEQIWSRIATISALRETPLRPTGYQQRQTLEEDNSRSSSNATNHDATLDASIMTSEDKDILRSGKLLEVGSQHIEFFEGAHFSPSSSPTMSRSSPRPQRGASGDSDYLMLRNTLSTEISEPSSSETASTSLNHDLPPTSGAEPRNRRSYISAFARPKPGEFDENSFILQADWLRQLARPNIPISAGLKKWLENGNNELESHKDSENDIERLLIIAVWWLLKSRILRNVLEHAATHSTTRKQGRPSQTTWHVKESTYRTAVDLVKCNYILQHVVLARVGTQNPLRVTEAQWKTVQDLSIAIEEEIRYNQDIQTLRSVEVLDHDVKGFSEPFIEGPQRWLAVDMQHCGSEDEKVLFRTFVDAQLGDRKVCRKSTTAPYLLVLWSRLGSGEIILSLVNLHGTVHLARNIMMEDIQRHEDHTDSVTEFVFNFPSQNAVIRFLSEENIEQFLIHPRRLFAANRSRTPKDCELLVFRNALDKYVSRYPSRSDNEPASESRGLASAHTACEISLFERVPHELWKTTRRIVISSTPGIQHQPWCVDFFLPLSMVQVRRVLKDVTLIWSDFTTLDEQGDGAYGKRYSYVYKPEKPDFELHVTFADTSGATAFEDCILHPFDTPSEAPEHVEMQTPIFQTPSTAQELQVYILRDRTATQKVGYYALCLTDNAPNANAVSEVYYLHRDLDFRLSTGPNFTIDFSGLHIPNYRSNMTDMISKPQPGSCHAKFSAADRRRKDAHFAFESVKEVSRLMRTLLGWDLKLIRSMKSVSISSKAHFLPKVQDDVTASLWQKSRGAKKEIRLMMRTGEAVAQRWTTAALDISSECARKSNKVLIKNVCLQQGHQIDGKLLVASNPLEEEQPRDTRGGLTMRFATADSARDLVACIYRLLDDQSSAFAGIETA